MGDITGLGKLIDLDVEGLLGLMLVTCNDLSVDLGFKAEISGLNQVILAQG